MPATITLFNVDTGSDLAVCEFDVPTGETDYMVELCDTTDSVLVGEMTLDNASGNQRTYSLAGFGATSGHDYRVDVWTEVYYMASETTTGDRIINKSGKGRDKTRKGRGKAARALAKSQKAAKSGKAS